MSPLAGAILEQLEGEGYRSTPARRRLLEAALSLGDGFTAEELAALEPGVGRATVYRTLRLLVERGHLCKLALQDGAPRYSLSRVGHHHHLVCVRCGAVREFREALVERVIADLAEGAGEVLGHRVEVYVLCNACSAARHGGSAASQGIRSSAAVG